MDVPLHDRNFRRLFAGRLVTNAGDSLYYVAAMWLVYDLTGDPFYTGVAGFLTMLPAAFQALLGPAVDRLDLRRLLVGTQAVQGVVVLGLAAVALADQLTVWMLLTVMPVLSLCNQLVYPAQSAALPRILEQEELVGANSAFSLAYQGVDFAFNGVAGTLVALVGAGALFLVDAATFGAAVVLFAALSIPAAGADEDGAADAPADATEDDPETTATVDDPETPATEDDPETPATEDDPGTPATLDAAGDGASAATDGGSEDRPAGGTEPGSATEDDDRGPVASYLAELRGGLAYLRGTFLLALMAGAVVVNAVLGGAMSVLPAYADGLGGAGAYGVLLAALAGGSLVGAVVAGKVAEYPLGRAFVAGLAVSGTGMLAAIWVDWLPATALLFGLSTVPVGATNVLITSVVQTATPEHLLGRVSATLGSTASMMQPVGALAGGAFASAFAPSLAFVAGALAILGFGAYVLAMPSLRTLPRPDEVETLSAG